MAVDAAGNLFIAQQIGQRIRKVDAVTGIITTVAGTGLPAFSGDGGPAVSAELSFPTGVGVDSAGNLFIADTSNNRIRKVDVLTGIITTVAGNGTLGGGGDGSAALSAQLDTPAGVMVDSAGNLYIAERNGQRIRRVDGATGIITTVAGTGTAGFSGDGGPATAAQLAGPYGVAVDAAGNLFIADTNNHRIRKVDGVTGVITTLAGTGAAGFSGDGGSATSAELNSPYGVVVDSTGNLFIADADNDRIRKVDVLTGVITTVAGSGTSGGGGDGGPATAEQLTAPYAVAADVAGNLFIADAEEHRVRKVDGSTGIISTVAGNGLAGFSGDGGLATNAQLSAPHGVAVDAAGNLFIADRGTARIRKVDGATGVITTLAGNGTAGFSGDGGPAAGAQLNFPHGVAVDVAGNLFIADTGNQRIRRVDSVTASSPRSRGMASAPGFSSLAMASRLPPHSCGIPSA